jgi:alcohol dehydrogenase class IV
MSLFGVLRLPHEIVFGAGQRPALAAIAARTGTKALVVTDERFATTPAFAEMMAGLKGAGVAVHVHDSVQPDVPRDSVAECTQNLGGFVPDMVIGIGGGSCLDFAKCSALLLRHGGALQDYYGEFKVPGPCLPLIAVPTTAGTGSEVTPVAVISDPERTLKVGISSPYLIASSAICDPELTYSCPAGLTAVTGADALTHAIEAFTAVRKPASADLPQQHVFVGKTALTDHFALLAIELLGRSLERAVRDGNDTAARADVMMAATAAGCAFGSAGTAAAHAIQYPVGAVTHTAHGLGVAALLPYVMTYNRAACAPEMARVALALGVDGTGKDDASLAQAAIDRVTELFAAIGIPTTLRDLGLGSDQVEWTAAQAIGIDRLIKNNPRPFDLSSMTRLVQAAFDGNREAAA